MPFAAFPPAFSSGSPPSCWVKKCLLITSSLFLRKGSFTTRVICAISLVFRDFPDSFFPLSSVLSMSYCQSGEDSTSSRVFFFFFLPPIPLVAQPAEAQDTAELALQNIFNPPSSQAGLQGLAEQGCSHLNVSGGCKKELSSALRRTLLTYIHLVCKHFFFLAFLPWNTSCQTKEGKFAITLESG